MRLPLKGLCIQLMAVPSEHLLLPKGLTFPPTAFVHMSRDGRTAEGVKGNIDVLKTQVGLSLLFLHSAFYNRPDESAQSAVNVSSTIHLKMLRMPWIIYNRMHRESQQTCWQCRISLQDARALIHALHIYSARSYS